MRACGTVLRKSLVYSMRGKKMSSAYFVWPVTLDAASTLRMGLSDDAQAFSLGSVIRHP